MNPLLRPSSIALAMVSLSIGWGIRGNYGHEFGAMMPGVLCALAVCLASGRQDWRERAPFFALFGALGWAFGGSIAYMPPLAYTHSGHWPTQLYGWFGVFVVGFLWASLGGAGTAYAAVETRERLTAVIRPFLWVLGAWTIEYFFQDRMISWFVPGYDESDLRHRSPLYWLDSEWMEANWALLALALFEVWDRRAKNIGRLAAFSAAGAAAGWLVQTGLRAAGLLGPITAFLVRRQGDPSAIDPKTGQPFGDAAFLTNWPRLFFDLAPHLGWILGLIVGAGVFFAMYGRWRSGSSLLLHMTLGSYAGFLSGPVLLSCLAMSVGGFRLTPPRGDSWANIAGALAGLLIYVLRNGLRPVGYVSILSGMLGGLGLVTAQFVKILMFIPGNPLLSSDPTWVKRWAHWHSSNWHSLVAEQGAGLLYGLSIVLPMAALSARLEPRTMAPRVRKWTESFSVFFVLAVLLYINLVKNVEDWTRVHNGHSALPASMKAPLFANIELTALGWFNVTFLGFAITLGLLLWAHQRKPLALVPSTWLGRGQLLYLTFLWAILIGNWGRALPGFTEVRLDTEWILTMNGLLATMLILICPRPEDRVAAQPATPLAALAKRTAIQGTAALTICACAFTLIHQWIYSGRHDGYGGVNLRFGPNADWRIKPLRTDRMHP